MVKKGGKMKNLFIVLFCLVCGVANATEMKAHVLAQEIPFDSAYWNVGADGSVSWAK